MPRASVLSISFTPEEMEAKKRQSMTRHNYDFDLLEAMKRKSVMNTVENGRESIASNLTAAQAEELAKAEAGMFFFLDLLDFK